MSWRDRRFEDPICYATQDRPIAKTFAAKEDGKPVPSAVLVFHGMGQQVRFQTLSDLASTILDEAEARGGNVTELHIGIAPKASSPGQFLARAEIAWTDKAGTPHAAHVYEAYWAPLTEGKVGYWDTIKFLLEGGWNGLRCIFPRVRWTFDRWVFGRFIPMPITKGTPLALLLVLAILLLTVGVIAMVSAAVANVFAAFSKGFESANPFVGAVGVLDTLYDQTAVTWNNLLGWAERMTHIQWIEAGRVAILSTKAHPSWWQYVLFLLAWAAGVGAILYVRYFLIAYVGSVAAYLSPYKDSKFEDLRGSIQAVGLDAARLIFYGSEQTPGAASEPAEVDSTEWVPHYGNIVFVAHSLGTVLAYDTLNAIFNIENTSRPPNVRNDAVARTRALITFGSPLDKAAFIFRAQFNRDTQTGRVREMLACAIQPLITDYKFRFNPSVTPPGPRWINLWSPLDIISGHLGYFDHEGSAPSADSMVKNIIDPACTIPIAAHTQYWTGKLLRKTVYDQLV